MRLDAPQKCFGLTHFPVAIVLQSIDRGIVFVTCNEILGDAQIAGLEGNEELVAQRMPRLAMLRNRHLAMSVPIFKDPGWGLPG